MGALIMTFGWSRPGTPVVGDSAAQLRAGTRLIHAIHEHELARLRRRDRCEASKASSIASTAQQLALSFGVAFGSVAAQWFLRGVPQTIIRRSSRLHQAFLVLGTITVLSSATFSGLRAGDGSNVSRHRAPNTEELTQKV